MNELLRALAKKIVPASILRMIRHHRNPVITEDLESTWDNKRVFFWNAFKALDFNGIDGDYVEFGSYSGITFRLAFDQIRQRKIKRHMWAFDSFQGLPEPSSSLDEHPGWKQGAMAMGAEEFRNICVSHGIPEDYYTTVRGFYEETVARMREDCPPTNIALAYIDCDMYSSSKTVLEFLAPRLKHGMIIAFDDYYCWSAEHISGERKALADFLAANKEWNWVRYRDFSWAGVSFVLERVNVIAPEGESVSSGAG